MTDLTVSIGSADVQQANAVLQAAQTQATGIDPPVLELGVSPSYQLAYASYATAGSTPWQSPVAVALPYGTPPAGVPSLRIWQLPDSLVNLPRQPTADDQPPLPCMGVQVAKVDESTRTTVTAPAASYGWATTVGVTVKKLPALAATPAAATTYELVGANEYDVVLLERMLVAIGLKTPGFAIDRLLLLHQAGGALASDGDQVMTFISQANLTTVTRPPATLAGARAALLHQTTQAPADFVRLLWECSITRSGGFYLYYCADPVAHTGLPDSIFNDKGEAVLTLLAIYAAPSDPALQNRVSNAMNAVVTAGFIDGSAAVSAVARAMPAYTQAGSGDALASLSSTYRTPVPELAEANADVPLAAQVTVDGGSYQVRPSAPGQAPAPIATWFGTSVADLEAANPGVDFSQDLALWATISLPDGLTVAPGTSGRATLAEAAAYYGVTVAALAAGNAPVQGIFAGQTIEVAELVTPGPDDTPAGIAARYYMDPVQLVEDNADVPLATGAKILAAGGLYEVPAAPGAGALAAIAARFGVDPSAIESANPTLSWTDPQPPLTLVFLPPQLTLQAGTSPGAATLGEIAGFYGVRLARLALDNAPATGLFTAPLRVRGGPLVRQAASPPGTVTYGMTRTAAPPPSDADPSAVLERLYNLLSYQVPAGLTGFKDTGPGPSLGPLTAPPSAGGDKMRRPSDDGIWRYQKAVPYSRLVEPPASNGPGPDPAQSPYLGTGGLLRLEFAWNDLFGNRGLTPLTEPALDPAAALNQPPAWALYTDPIVGLSEWPSIGFDYQVVAGQTAGTAELRIALAFDGCTYLTGGEQGCPQSPNPPKVDPVERAKRDMQVYARIVYQMTAPGGLAVTVDTSLLPGGPQAVDAAPLEAFAAEIHDWLAARAGGDTSQPFPAMSPISIPLALTEVETAQIFELTVALTMSRPPDLVDPDLRVESKAAANPSAIPPHQSQATPGGPYTLAAFASGFEQAMTAAGQWQLKLAVGVDRENAERSGAGAPLWAVRIGLDGTQPLAFSVPDATQPVTYAPRPVSNAPRSGSVSVTPYVTGSGLTGQPTTQSFTGVDLDGWTAQLLAAVDRLLSPSYATAIGLIDSALPTNRTAHLQALATAKENLANALKELVIPVLPGAAGPDPGAARDAFGQQLLVQLGSFYTTDAIVQFEVDAVSQATDPTTSPQLFGDLEQTGDDPAPVTLSDPKVPLAEPASGPPPTLTFLLTTAVGQTDIAQTEAQVTLALSYEGTNVEHQIGSVPGISGYTASSWLSFVSAGSSPLSATLGPFTVPLVLRGFPTPPTMRAQSGTQAVPDGTPDLTLAETLAWDYQLVYSTPFHYQQDTVHLTLELNHGAGARKAHDRRPTALAGDPLAALAQFVSVYPQVQADIDAYVAPVDPSKLDPASQAFIDGDVALTTFTDLAESVAGTLGGGVAAQAQVTGSLPGEQYELTITEGAVELPSRSGSGATVDALLVTVGDVPEALGATVAVDIEGCTAQAPPSTAAGGDSTCAYVYVDQATGDWLPASTGETIGPRTVTIPGLNVLARQDAWASTYIERNENAAEPFRYQTPTVYFASPQYPTNRYTDPPIEVASIGASGPQKRSPEAHLAALFGALFANAPQGGEQTIQLECRYEYALSGAGLEPIDLPVYLLAPTAADPATDLVVPTGGCPVDRTQGPLVCRLGGAMRTWWAANAPSDAGGAFPLAVTVMSALTAQPLIVLGNLRLTEQWIDWS